MCVHIQSSHRTGVKLRSVTRTVARVLWLLLEHFKQPTRAAASLFLSLSFLLESHTVSCKLRSVSLYIRPSLCLSCLCNTEVCGLTSQEMVSHSLNLVYPKGWSVGPGRRVRSSRRCGAVTMGCPGCPVGTDLRSSFWTWMRCGGPGKQTNTCSRLWVHMVEQKQAGGLYWPPSKQWGLPVCSLWAHQMGGAGSLRCESDLCRSQEGPRRTAALASAAWPHATSDVPAGKTTWQNK